MFITILMVIVYLSIFLFTFKSFIRKESLNFYTSLSMTFGFFLISIVFITNLIMLVFNIESYPISAGIISVDLLGIFFIFFASTRIRSVMTESPNLLKRKLFNVSFFLLASLITFIFSYNYASINTSMITPIIFNNDILNLQYMISIMLLLTLASFHVPSFKEYKYIRIGTLAMVARIGTNILINVFLIPNLEILAICLGIVSLISWFISMKALYKKAKPL